MGAGSAGERVAAYVAVDPGRAGAAELTELATTLLPQRLIPTALAVVSGLEFATGVSSADYPSAQADQAEPAADALAALHALFAEVLHAPGAGLNDDFFDLGGQSVTAMLLIARINAALGVQLSIADLFNSPTVAELEARTRSLRAPSASPFDAEDALYTALSSPTGVQCLWPAALATPAGWEVAHGPAARADCLDHAERHGADPDWSSRPC